MEGRVKAAAFLARVREMEEGEKPSAYFFQALRARRNASSISGLRGGDGLVLEIKPMLAVAESFYSELFSARRCDPGAQEVCLKAITARLGVNEAGSLESPLSLEEMGVALGKMRDGRAAGHDGLPKEFFVTFWDLLGPDLLEKEPTIVVETPTPKPNAVKVHCGESSVQFEVDMDLLGIGHLIQPSDITLGGCGPVGQHGSEVLLFETELHGCGSVLAMMDDALVYTFALNYQPNSIGATPIIRTSSAVVGLQCHYMRLHNVSSNALKPTWIPYHSTLSAEELLVFSMRLMADHWQLERGSNVFFLGDLINIEVSVVQANHMPLRVFVDTCVATLDPDMNAVPRYAFIENDGCLMDSKLTNSRSQFLSRVQDDKLQFQLDAFRFAQEARSAYMSLFCFPGAQYAGTAVLGPIVVQEAAKESQSRVKADDRAEGPSEAMIIAGVMAAVGFVCMIVLGTLLVRRRYKPLV
ncbi:hypothetical protein SKAU_G00385030 [Synaphobranchus kaupii]|uniref:Zona pellucida sperm-binding protein 3 n=1 Tax=Synaphobranchus kaupii TaxID=118154 RepID=A0A9Q1EEE5_SYNKA|nr:hypothetical protein SKAU_G00385030 [Synaphobranchus kaupii]